MLVGVRRALALAKPAERTADGADVRDVDVAVDDERHRLPRQFLAQLVGGLTDLLDRLRPGLREQRRQLIRAQRQPVASPLDCTGHQLGTDRRNAACGRVGTAGPASRDEAPVVRLDRVQHPVRYPLGIDVLRVDTQPLGQRDSVGLQLLAHLVRRGERMLGGDVIAVGAETAEVGGARPHELAPPVGEVRRDLDTHVGHQPARFRDQALHVLDADRAGPVGQRQFRPLADGRTGVRDRVWVRRIRGCGVQSGGALLDAGAPVLARGRVGDLSRLLAVVALMRDEVLEDHLLDVAVLVMNRGQRLQRFDPLSLGLADPDEYPAREWDLQFPGGPDRLQAACWMLGGRARVDGLHQTLRHRLQHQPLRSRHLTQPRQILAGEHTEVRVRQEAPLERPVARPDDVRGEVLVPVLLQPFPHLGVDLGMLAGQHQQLLHLPLGRAFEDLEHLIGRVQVRLVGRERAVLAVAPARPRQRQRQVAAERDPSAHCRESAVSLEVTDLSDGAPRLRPCPKIPYAARSPR